MRGWGDDQTGQVSAGTAERAGRSARRPGRRCWDIDLHLPLIGTGVVCQFEVVGLLDDSRDRQSLALEAREQLTRARFADGLTTSAGVGDVAALLPAGRNGHHQQRVGCGHPPARGAGEDQDHPAY